MHYNCGTRYLFVSGEKIYHFKADDKNFCHFCLRRVSEKLHTVESKEVSLKQNAYDFSVDYNAIDKS